MERVKQALETIVAEVAADRQLTLIIRKDQAVFASPEIEITDDVMKRLTSAFPVFKSPIRVADRCWRYLNYP